MQTEFLELSWNPAYQLAVVVDEKAIKPHSSKTIYEAWRERLGISPSRRELVLYAIGRIGSLPSYVQQFMTQIHGDDSDMYTRWVKPVSQQLNTNSLDRNMSDIVKQLNSERRGQIDICAHQIQIESKSPRMEPSGEQEIRQLRNEIEKCIVDVIAADIPGELRKFTLKHLHIVERGLVDFQVLGHRGGSMWAELSLGQAAIAPELARQMSTHERTSSAVSLLGRFVLLVQSVQGGEYLIEKAQGLAGFLSDNFGS